jgi:hypothetical protein
MCSENSRDSWLGASSVDPAAPRAAAATPAIPRLAQRDHCDKPQGGQELRSEVIDPAAYDTKDSSRPVAIDFQQLFLEQESDEEDSAELADALAVLDTRFPIGTFKAADIASLINANGNTTDGAAVREFLFPGGKVDQVVSTKAVSKRLGAHVGNPVRLGEIILSLCSGKVVRSRRAANSRPTCVTDHPPPHRGGWCRSSLLRTARVVGTPVRSSYKWRWWI